MTPSADSRAHDFCIAILPEVSRTFALNIAVLRGRLHRAVLCGYLFCRTADTFEDFEGLDRGVRRELLEEFIRIFREKDFAPARIEALAVKFPVYDHADPEHRLIRNCRLVFEDFMLLPPRFRDAVGACVIEMSEGMMETLESGPGVDGRRLATVADMPGLERYCYFVAGTVGVMLTRIFTLSSRMICPFRAEEMAKLDVAFGLGLQMTNIVKDCHKDFGRGWCYLPADMMKKEGLEPENFFNLENRSAALRVIDGVIRAAAGHLDDAFRYVLLIPRFNPRMRMFCLWPLFMAVKTLAVARGNEKLLSGREPVKITRSDVKRIVRLTSLFACSNGALKILYRRYRSQIGID